MIGNFAIVLIGSNIEPEKNVIESLKILKSRTKFIHESRFDYTKPIGFQDQDDFLNGMVLVRTGINNEQFEAFLKETEEKLGRIRTDNKSGPRTIDLDLVSWNGAFVYKDKDVMKATFFNKMIIDLVPHYEKLSKKEFDFGNILYL